MFQRHAIAIRPRISTSNRYCKLAGCPTLAAAVRHKFARSIRDDEAHVMQFDMGALNFSTNNKRDNFMFHP